MNWNLYFRGPCAPQLYFFVREGRHLNPGAYRCKLQAKREKGCFIQFRVRFSPFTRDKETFFISIFPVHSDLLGFRDLSVKTRTHGFRGYVT